MDYASLLRISEAHGWRGLLARCRGTRERAPTGSPARSDGSRSTPLGVEPLTVKRMSENGNGPLGKSHTQLILRLLRPELRGGRSRYRPRSRCAAQA